MSSRGTVVVTGASGYIAKHIVQQLLDAGYHVRGTVRSAKRGEDVLSAVAPLLEDASDLDQRLAFAELDLNSDTGWTEAMAGADMLVHTASPFPIEQPRDENAVIRPAVDGTLRALSAARDTGIGRVVMTSSAVAIMGSELGPGRDRYDERDWSDLTRPQTTPYMKSKTLAEKAAWAFVETQAPELKLTVINPTFVTGPPLDEHFGTSMQVVQRLLRSKDPMLPNFGFPTVDVRDIAAMHVRALERSETIGKRIIGADRFLWYADMAKVLKAAFPDRKITTRQAPDFVVRFLSLFDGAIRTIVPNLGRREEVSSERAHTLLGMDFRDTRESVRQAAGYLLAHDLV
jgi:dihydroflavonol-4-reductase